MELLLVAAIHAGERERGKFFRKKLGSRGMEKTHSVFELWLAKLGFSNVTPDIGKRLPRGLFQLGAFQIL